MPSFNKRNSRDDKSKNARGSFSKNPAKKNSPSRERTEKPRFQDRKEDSPYGKARFGDRQEGASSDKPRFSDRKGDTPYGKPKFRSRQEGASSDKPRFSDHKGDAPYGKAKFGNRKEGASSDKPRFSDRKSDAPYGKPKFRDRKEAPQKRFEADPVNDGLIRLNRYISNAGVCSRRKADELIEAGVITVNGEVVTTLGSKVDPAKDDIRYNGERLKREKMVYVLLNKPKDYITTTDDPQERRTVMHLVAKASRERIYPVGRLDRNTTGLLLMTNDGLLSEKLSHPRNHISKLYYVELNKNLTQGDFNKIAFGLELEDGLIKPDDLSYVQGSSKSEVGIQIHSGKNRIVRRIFEHLGYEVIKLDRVVYANLTKKDLPRGHWRYLEEREIIQLKHLIK